MRRKQQLRAILMAGLAGFMGGMASNQLVRIHPAFADKGAANRKVVIAEEFQVVDPDGQIVGRFGTFSDPPDIPVGLKTSKTAAMQLRLGQEPGFQIILSAGAADGARIILKDAGHKTRAVIGNTQLYVPQTRTTYDRQVSSIVLFDNYGRFLWSAPGGIQTDPSR
jgi:hypothetical protein